MRSPAPGDGTMPPCSAGWFDASSRTPFVQQMLYEGRAHEQMREFDAFAETMHAEENAARLQELLEAIFVNVVVKPFKLI